MLAGAGGNELSLKKKGVEYANEAQLRCVNQT